MPPALTVVFIVVGATIATIAGLLLAGAIASDEPEQFFNAYFAAFVVFFGGIGGLVVGAAAGIAWSVVSARSRRVRAICTALTTLVVTALVVIFISIPTGGVVELLLMFIPAGLLAAITTATAAALALQLEPQKGI